MILDRLHKGILVWISLFLIGGLGNAFVAWKIENKNMLLQQKIANEIIRFHVIANSDSKEDQDLKLLVKNEVVKEVQQKLENVENIEEARKILSYELSALEEIASSVIQKNGYSYSAKASLLKREFPVKMYGDLVFPAGEYEAVQIKLGNAEGKNWWCVMFPTLCFLDGTYAVVPEESKEELKQCLTQEEYQVLEKEKSKYKISFRWKCMDWLKK